jgi:sialate O-acetylesterase
LAGILLKSNCLFHQENLILTIGKGSPRICQSTVSLLVGDYFMRIFRLAAVLIGAFSATTIAQIRLPNLLSDHAVLQRDQPVHIWGWSKGGETVTIHFHEQTLTATADTLGEWETWLKPERAGGPYTLTISGNITANSITRKDLLLGDVWIASGQSNMQFPLNGFPNLPLKDGEKEIAAAKHPRMRLLLQKRMASPVPLDDIPDSWTECTPDTARNFSAVAYFFGREISEHEDVPVGLIDATWGGTPAHSWISLDALAAANLTSVFNETGKITRDQGRADSIRNIYEREEAALKAEGKPVPPRPRIPNDRQNSWIPGTLFNAMIAPDTRFTIKGVIWYQGETDTEPQRSHSYSRVFQTLISDWRQQWHQGDFPFLFVQISSFHSPADWPVIRDAQRKALSLRNTGMAVTLDAGAADNVHPPDKQTVGDRLARIALAMSYGEKIEGSSPEFTKATAEASDMRVWFEHAKGGLTTHGQPLGGFELAGEDHIFKPAAATIEQVGDAGTVLVSSPNVQSPRFVRYGWSDVVTNYLYNSAGLPVGTFSSE